MKNSRSVSIFNDLHETKFHVVFLGVNLPGALLAYQLARSGKKVALFFPSDFNRQDDFRFTRIFPENVKSVSAARNRLKLALRIITQSSHLFLQQRMVWLRGNLVSNKLLAQAYNQLAVQDDSEKAGTLKLGDYPEYAFFHQKKLSIFRVVTDNRIQRYSYMVGA